MQFLEWRNINWIEVTGNVPASQRTKRIKQFKDGGPDDPRVLVLSGVGLVGLNLACANILILMVGLWHRLPSSIIVTIAIPFS